MELPIKQGEDGYKQLRADVPLRVVIAFDQLADDEKAAVLTALQTLERNGLEAASALLKVQRLGGPEPLYALRAAPDVQVLVRVRADEQIDVMDIVRPATLRNFAHATS